MATPDVGMSDIGLIALSVLVLWLPGGAFAAAAGLRGWSLAAAAPLFTYSIAGLAAPWYSAMGVPWSPLTFALTTVVLTAVAYLARWRRGRPRRSGAAEGSPWSRRAQLGVVGTVLAAALIGGWVVLTGLRGLATIPDHWDAVFHANGIRWIAETGDGGLFAMSQVNWFENGGIFYPNAYHLVGSVVYRLDGSPLPNILNAHTVLLPGLLALTLAALIRRFRGRAMLAASAALVVVGATELYDPLWRGPLLPFAAGVALTPVVAVLLLDFLEAGGRRAMIEAGVRFVVAAAGLVCLHSSMMFSIVIFILPVIVLRWWRRPRLLRWEPLALAAAGLVGAGLLARQLAGAVSNVAVYPPSEPLAELSTNEAIGALLTFGHAIPQTPQWWLTGLLALGLVDYRRLGELRWLGMVAVVFGFLFVITASIDEQWVTDLTRPWWNDRWRLVVLATVPLCVIAANGLLAVQRACAAGLTAGSRWLLGRRDWQPVVASAVAALLVVALLGQVSRGLDAERNEAWMAHNTFDSAIVSPDEVAAYRTLATIVPPGTRVLNDRGDGSAWMYALAGVLPVAGHWDANLVGPDATLLAVRFHDYPNDPDVQAAVARLRVRYVVVGRGFLLPTWYRQSGLTGLDDADWLELIYRNDDAAIYRIREGEPADGRAKRPTDRSPAAQPG